MKKKSQLYYFMRSAYARNLRQKLYRRQRGRCSSCRCAMTIGVSYAQAPNKGAIATLDHLYQQGDLRRHLPEAMRAVVLVCYDCNQRRNIVFQCLQKDSTYALLYPPVDIRTFLTDQTKQL